MHVCLPLDTSLQIEKLNEWNFLRMKRKIRQYHDKSETGCQASVQGIFHKFNSYFYFHQSSRLGYSQTTVFLFVFNFVCHTFLTDLGK